MKATTEYIIVSVVCGWGKNRRRQKLQRTLDSYAAEGWRLRQILHAHLLTSAREIVFEREVTQNAKHVIVMT